MGRDRCEIRFEAATEPPSADPGRIRRLQRRRFRQVDVQGQEETRQHVADGRSDHPQRGHQTCAG